MTEPSRRIDLNALRAARAEAAGEPIILTVGDEDVELPPEMPLAVATGFARLASGDPTGIDDALGALLGPESNRIITEHSLTLTDLMELMEAAGALYGVTVGESSASAPSSPPAPRPSKPTSSATTPARTSATRSSGPTP